ncbi:unnamed protein product [Prunus armeniaca]|uniref:Uncharacterized protein n=1 Tax=Prunus armeniaca TaxID=36596 RepID=A0A6J5UF76_PRUAR|nr:unnamed protein product [Prunus armeniaca]
MMLVDGCFIIELLCKQLDLSPVEDDDAISRRKGCFIICKYVSIPRRRIESSHLLETVRNFVVQPYMEVCEDMEYRTPIPSVSELREIGVKFVASDNVKYSGRYDIPLDME